MEIKRPPSETQRKALKTRVLNFGCNRLAGLLPGNRTYHYVYDKCHGFNKLNRDDVEKWTAIMDEADRRDS
jgi:hypothetical protein